MVRNKGNPPAETGGTPSYVLFSLLFALFMFALEGLRDLLKQPADLQYRQTSLAFVLLGIAVAFFWRRLQDGPLKSMSSWVFSLSFWAYHFLFVTAGISWVGGRLGLSLPTVHLFGTATLALSSLLLIGALLYNTRLVPPLLFSACAALMAGLGTVMNFVGHGPGRGSHEIELSAAALVDPQGHLAENSHASQDTDDIFARQNDADDKEDITEIPPSVPQTKDSGPLAPAPHNTGSQRASAPVQPSPPSPREELREPRRARAQKLIASRHPQVPKDEGHATHWEYSGELGPSQWGAIDPSFAQCDEGTEQSPIDIPRSWKAEESISLDYKMSHFEAIDNGHTIQFTVESGNFAAIGGQQYELRQIHFHTPSEHHLAGKAHILEAHFVHSNPAGKLAVIGAFIQVGSSHTEFAKLWEYIPFNTGEKVRPKQVTFEPRKLLPRYLKAYRYPGSLTTPPCSEKVDWNVLQEPLQMSQAQIDTFRKKYSMNARPIQPRLDRP